MFRSSSADPDTKDWDVSNVTDMRQMFRSSTADPDVSGWVTSNVERMDDMFSATTYANPDVSGWDTSNVENMAGMFNSAEAATPVTTTNENTWNTHKVTSMANMFNNTKLANPDVSGWKTSNVTTMAAMFHKSKLANPDVSTKENNIWDVSNVTTMQHMFQESESATLQKEDGTTNWNTHKVQSMQEMFRNALVANPDVSKWDTSNVTKMAHMFDNADAAEPVTTTVGNIWNTHKVVSMSSMFDGAALATPDTTDWDVSNVTHMTTMFRNTVFADPDVGKWDVSKVGSMQSMFYGAEVANPNVSSWNTINVATMEYMFFEADNANPDTSGWDIGKVQWMQNIFKDSDISNANYSKFLIMAEDTCSGSNNCDNATINFGSLGDSTSKYYAGDAATARATLVTNGWSISDNGEMIAPPTGISLVNPISDESPWQLPTFQVSGVANGDDVTLYYSSVDSECGTEIGSAISTGAAVDIQVSSSLDQSDDAYNFYATTEDTGGDLSDCSTETDSYTVEDPIKVFAGFYNTCVINSGADAVCWGDNSEGQLGQEGQDGQDPATALLLADDFGDGAGETPDSTDILPGIDLNGDPQDIAMGTHHICALLDTNEVKCWGRHNVHNILGTGNPTGGNNVTSSKIGDEIGEMSGDGTVTHYVEEIDFGGTLVPEQITAGEDFSCARFTDDSVKCWGWNAYGQLGFDSNTAQGNSFHPISSESVIDFNDEDVLDISSNKLHSCAVIDGGNVKCWGSGMNGRLGQDDLNVNYGTATNTMDDLNNVSLGAGLSATSVAVGERHSCALLSSGEVKCWGEGANGRLGNGETDVVGDGDIDVSSVTNMREMFAQTTYANPDVANWDTSKVRDMREMFWAAAAAKPDTSKWNTSQVRSMRGMFNGAGNANPVTSSWDMSSIVDPEYIFTNSGISQENYDLFLIMSEATSSNSGIKVNSPAQYSTGDAADARQSLIDDHGWEFSDKGCLDCSP